MMRRFHPYSVESLLYGWIIVMTQFTFFVLAQGVLGVSLVGNKGKYFINQQLLFNTGQIGTIKKP